MFSRNVRTNIKMEFEKNLQVTLALSVGLGLGLAAGYLIANKRRIPQGALQAVKNVWMKFHSYVASYQKMIVHFLF